MLVLPMMELAAPPPPPAPPYRRYLSAKFIIIPFAELPHLAVFGFFIEEGSLDS